MKREKQSMHYLSLNENAMIIQSRNKGGITDFKIGIKLNILRSYITSEGTWSIYQQSFTFNVILPKKMSECCIKLTWCDGEQVYCVCALYARWRSKGKLDG